MSDQENIIEVIGSATNSFRIDHFRTEIWKGGTLPTHSYLATLAPFSKLEDGQQSGADLNSFMQDNRDLLVLRCDNAILPGINIMTDSNVRRYGYGPVEYMPHGVTFNNITLNWIVDANGDIPRFFQEWARLIVNYDSKGGADMQGNPDNSYGYSPYEVGYKDEYSNSKMSIFVYDHGLNTALEYQIYDVFPISVTDIPLNWGEQDSVIRLSVIFAFTDFNIAKATQKKYMGFQDMITEGFDTLVGGNRRDYRRSVI